VYREVITKIEQLGGTVARDGPKGLITINGEFTGSIVIARCLSTRGGSAMRWNLRLDTALRPDITIAVRLAPDTEQSMDYYLLPSTSRRRGCASRSAMGYFWTLTASTRSTAFFKSALGRAWDLLNDNHYRNPDGPGRRDHCAQSASPQQTGLP
jgi:hypothetical protein